VLVAVLATLLSTFGGVAAAAPDPAAAEGEFLALVNGERAAGGLGALVLDPAVVPIARERSGQMAQENRLYHRGDLRAQIEGRVTRDWQRIAENVGKGYDVAGLHAAFMASPGHRANVLGDFNRVGVGVVVSGDVVWVTFNFLKGPGLAPPPRPAATPVPVSTPAPAPVAVRTIDRACPTDRMPTGVFADVPASDVHARSIDCMAWWSVAGGVAPNAFAPAGQVSRAQMASFVAREIEASGFVLPPAGDYFGDDAGSVHEARINQLAAVGVVGGVAPGTFRPGDLVSRAQMATFLVRAHDLVAATDLAATGNRFADDAGNVHEANIDKAAGAGLAGGTSGGGFSPSAAVSRAQLTSFLARNLDLLVEEGKAAAR